MSRNEKKIYKNALKQIFGCYSWTVANRSKKGEIYFASTPERHVPLVLAPSEELVAKIENMGTIEVLESYQSLFLMARSIGRALAWPALSCNFLEALHKDISQRKDLARNRDHYWPLNHAFVIPWTGHDSSKCVWVDTLWSACLERGRGLLPQEFHHLLSSPHSQGKIEGLTRNMTMDVYDAKVKPVSEMQVLFVDHVVAIEGLGEPVKRELAAANERGQCWALSAF